MEVSNEIKEDIRKNQSELKNAIRVHQMWVARLQDDENNVHLKFKVREAEKEIIAIGQNQKQVVDRLRRELELYQQHLKARNKQINIENDNRYIAQQLRDHQIQCRGKNRSFSLLKPSVLNELHIKAENKNGHKANGSDSDNELKSNEKENSNHSEDKFRYSGNYQSANSVNDSRSNFSNALNRVKESFIGAKLQHEEQWPERRHRSDSDSTPPGDEPSPCPSPPRLAEENGPVTQDTFLRIFGLVPMDQKEMLIKKRDERRKRSTISTNKTDFLYGYESMPKRKKNQFPYLQTHTEPPQTRSAKLKKQQGPKKRSRSRSRSRSCSRSRSPSSSSSGAAAAAAGAAASWASRLPPAPSAQPPPARGELCHGCGRNDVPSLLVRCGACGVLLHTGCGRAGRCGGCRALLPDPAPRVGSAGAGDKRATVAYRDKLAERKRLQEKNIQLCIELRKLEARTATLKENLEDHHSDKRQLLASQIKTQRNLQKLLDFISQFKETSVSVRSTSVSDTGSDVSKSNDE